MLLELVINPVFILAKIVSKESGSVKNSVTVFYIVCAVSLFGCLKFVLNPFSTFTKKIGPDRFGESGKLNQLYKKFGLTPEQIAERIKGFLKEF